VDLSSGSTAAGASGSLTVTSGASVDGSTGDVRVGAGASGSQGGDVSVFGGDGVTAVLLS